MLIKSGDAGYTWSQFSPSLVSPAPGARASRSAAGSSSTGESRRPRRGSAPRRSRAGADCLVIDAEGHYEGRYRRPPLTCARCATASGADYPLGLSSLPLRRLPPGLPLLSLPRAGGRAVQPAAALLEDDRRPCGRGVRPHVRLEPRLRAADPADGPDLHEPEAASRSGASAASRWRTAWRASAGGPGSTRAGASGRRSRRPCLPILGYQRYDSFPFLRLGSKGDLVAWAQQLLAGGGSRPR